MSSSSSTSSPPCFLPCAAVTNENAWSAHAEAYEKVAAVSFTEFYAHKLVQQVSLSSSQTVLDAACGPGVVAFLAAPSGAHVIASDFSDGMVDLVRKRATERGISNIRAMKQDLATLDGLEAASLDAIFVNFGVFFVKDTEAAFRRMRELLKEGGSLVFSTWAGYSESDLQRLVTSLAVLLRAPTPSADELSHLTVDSWSSLSVADLPPPPFLPDPEIVKEKLLAAGFDAAAVHSQKFSTTTPKFADIGEFLKSISTSPGVGDLISAALPQRQHEIELKVTRLLRDIHVMSPSNFALKTAGWVHVAKKTSPAR